MKYRSAERRGAQTRLTGSSERYRGNILRGTVVGVLIVIDVGQYEL